MTKTCAVLLSPAALPLASDLIEQSLLRLQSAFPDAPIYIQRAALQNPPFLDPGLALETIETTLLALQEKNIISNGLQVLQSPHWKEALRQIFVEHASEPYDSVAYLDGWCPLLDLSLTEELKEQHQKYLAHVSYGENLPPGLVPDFIAWDFIQKLPDSIAIAEPPRNFAFQNVESFDVELFYKSPDLRLWRLDFSCRDARSVKLVEDVLEIEPALKEAGTPFSPTEISDLFQKNPKLFRPFPACFEVELCGRADVEPIYRLPLPQADLEASLYEKLLLEIEREGLFQDATIILGGSGDALLYDGIADVCKKTLAKPNVKSLVLETYLTELSEDFFSYLSSLESPFEFSLASSLGNANDTNENTKGLKAAQSEPENANPKARLHLIIRLGSVEKTVWQDLHKSSHFSRVMENIHKIEEILQKRNAGFSCYAEALRMKENDDHIDSFMNRFGDDSPIRPLLGKYNSFLGELPDRRAVDLTPLSRGFCWHLARDLYLNAQGRVAFCKQDPFAAKGPSWDFRSLALQEIWKQGREFWESSFFGQHDKLPLPCMACDEWYTFNA